MVKVIRIFLLLLVIISTGGVYFQFYSTYINILSLLLSFLLLWVTKISMKEISIRVIFSLFFLLLILLIHFLLNLRNSVEILDYISIFTHIFIVFVILYHYKRLNIAIVADLNILLLIIMVHGFFNFIIINIFHYLIFEWKSEILQFSTKTIGYVFFTADNFLPSRNCGLFWEPGVFQFFINLFLFINLFVARKVRPEILVFGFLMILSTQSTMGILIFLLMISWYFYLNLSLKKIFIFLFLAIFSLLLFIPNIKEKFSGKYKTSYQARVFDTVTGLSAISQKPLLGYGFHPRNNSNITYNSNTYKTGIKYANLKHIYKRGNTNSITMNFVYWGIPIGLLFLSLLYNQSIIKERKMLFFLICVFTCLGEPLLFSGIFLLILFSSFVSKNFVNYYTINENC